MLHLHRMWKVCWTLCSQHAPVLLLCAPQTILRESTFQNDNHNFHFQDNLFCSFELWSEWLHTKSRWMLSCLNCAELQFNVEQNLIFFSFEMSTVRYWRNKLWASGFGLFFFSFFSHGNSGSFAVICGTAWDSTSSSSPISLLTGPGLAPLCPHCFRDRHTAMTEGHLAFQLSKEPHRNPEKSCGSCAHFCLCIWWGQ